MQDFCQEVPLEKAYRLINHGPTVLVSAQYENQRDVMAAAWSMPIDFAPPKIAVVLDKASWTRTLLEQSKTFVVQVPTVAQVDLVQTVGSISGRALFEDKQTDKFLTYDIAAFAGKTVTSPCVSGCVAWLECRLLAEPHNQERYDLFLGAVVAAYADTRVFSDGHWHFEQNPEMRTIHHVAGGHFLAIGNPIIGHVKNNN